MNSKEFERNEAIRKSIRLKAPPAKLEVATPQTTHTSGTSSSQPSSTVTSPVLSRLRRPLVTSPLPLPRTASTIRERNNLRNNNTKDVQQRPSPAAAAKVDIRDNYSLKLSDITKPSAPHPPEDADEAKGGNTTGENESLSVLQTLERQINTMEFDERMKQRRDLLVQPPGSPGSPVMTSVMVARRKDRPVHYGELPSLLNTGISDVATGNGFGYLERGDESGGAEDSDDDLLHARQNVFKRGEDGRSSTGGTTGYRPKPKTTRIVNRTVSDTKNAETTVKTIRLKKLAPKPPIVMTMAKPPAPPTAEIASAGEKVVPTLPSRTAVGGGSNAGSSSTTSSSMGSGGTTPNAGKPSAAAITASILATPAITTEKKISAEMLKQFAHSQKVQVN